MKAAPVFRHKFHTKSVRIRLNLIMNLDTVDPKNIPVEMTHGQREYWVLFGVAVAGKSASVTAKKLDELLVFVQKMYPRRKLSPFQKIQLLSNSGLLGEVLRFFRFGQYSRVVQGFKEACLLDVDNLHITALEKVTGIGMKTARMIVLYTQPNAKVVPLDRHVLKFLRKLGHKAPESSPSDYKTYFRLEQAFIAEAALRCVSVRQLDTEVWKSYAA